jgi:hypothetical protein
VATERPEDFVDLNDAIVINFKEFLNNVSGECVRAGPGLREQRAEGIMNKFQVASETKKFNTMSCETPKRFTAFFYHTYHTPPHK